MENNIPISVERIPVFITSFNRVSYLKKLIAKLEEMGFRNLIIIDNLSTFQPLLDYLDKCPYRVERLEKNYGHLALWHSKKFDQIIYNEYFILTDCDVVPADLCPNDMLDVFYSLLTKNTECTKVGPSLRIDNFPEDSLNKDSIIEWESQFWEKKRDDGHFDASIDTTFALYRPGIDCNNINWWKSIRTDFPYVAEHLTWYEDIRNPTEELLFYQNNVLHASTWWSVTDPVILKKANISYIKENAELVGQNKILNTQNRILQGDNENLEKNNRNLEANNRNLQEDNRNLKEDCEKIKLDLVDIRRSINFYSNSIFRFMPRILFKKTYELFLTSGRFFRRNSLTDVGIKLMSHYQRLWAK